MQLERFAAFLAGHAVESHFAEVLPVLYAGVVDGVGIDDDLLNLLEAAGQTRDRQPVQVFREGNSDLPPSRSVKLTWGPRGYRVQNLPKGGGWSLSDIDAALERMGRRDRRPAS